jgi:hypothetical protein
MKLSEFVSTVRSFDAMADREKVRHFGWFLHTHRKMQLFATGDIRKCFEELRLVPPNVSLHLIRMAEAKPPSLIRSKGKYKLHRREMTELDGLYAAHPSTIAASALLTELPAKVPDLAERAFLQEAIDCYRVKAYRATIVMTWNLTYDHLTRWIFADPVRVASLHTALMKRFPKKAPTIAVLGDLENIKEFDVIESCGTARLISSNLLRILKEKLSRRNMAAHPSSVVVLEPQANDTITDLVKNVVLAIT